MKIGRVIREIRESQPATLEDVAYLAKTTASNLSRVELDRHGCSPDMLQRIASALGVSVAEIYRRAEALSGRKVFQTLEPFNDANNQKDVLLNRNYEDLNDEYRAIVNDFIKMMLKRQRQMPK